ncbi:hypothetical protein [Deinococcus sp. UYEF24]
MAYLPQQPAFYSGTVLGELQKPFGHRIHTGRSFDLVVTTRSLNALGQIEAFLRLEATTRSGGETQTLPRSLLNRCPSFYRLGVTSVTYRRALNQTETVSATVEG